MLSLLPMLKLVTLQDCFHNMQQIAEQQCVKYYRNKRHIFKLVALSSLPAHDSIKDWTVSTAQAIRLNMDQYYIHFTRTEQMTEMSEVREIFDLCDRIEFFVSIYYNCIAYLLSLPIPFPV